MLSILSSEQKRAIVRTIFQYPKRQWSCSFLEESTKKPHATVFRTLKILRDFGIIKSIKVNRRDIIYELVGSPITYEINKIVNLEKTTARKIALNFINKIKKENIVSIILYGSSITGNMRPDSDIDILFILNKHDKRLEKYIFDKAAEYSSEINKTISIVIMDLNDIKREKDSNFLKSVNSNMGVLYGKEPF